MVTYFTIWDINTIITRAATATKQEHIKDFAIHITAQGLWNYSLTTYAKQGVEDACLQAQDQYGADVNVIMLISYLTSQGLTLSPDGLAAVIKSSHDLRGTLEVMRSARRAAKGSTEYESLKAQELDLEKQAQSVLVNCCSDELTAIKDDQHLLIADYCKAVSKSECDALMTTMAPVLSLHS